MKYTQAPKVWIAIACIDLTYITIPLYLMQK